ncbi:Mu transposase C-terminal domain-containing protein [Arthrobacter sp. RAF14]|uniref:Mu transposase C-terminal domain-containing protein n=1 Tax=Arthrobacter sp. RAF14 TaxID=3233051 RepID=UPI003F905F69
MDELRVGDRLSLEDGDYVLESFDGVNLRLRDEATSERQIVHITALPGLLEAPRGYGLSSRGPRDFPLQGEQISKRVVFLAAHLDEVLSGTPLTGGEARAEYDLGSTTLRVRLERKSAELDAAGMPVSVRSLERWAAAYKRGGKPALTDGRLYRRQQPLGHLDDRVAAILASKISAETNRSSGTVTRLIQEVRNEVMLKYPVEQPLIPSDSTLRRYIALLSKGRYTTGNAMNRRTAANPPDRMYNSRVAIAPGHEVQVDTSPYDILVVVGYDDVAKAVRVGRAKLVIMLDRATQSIIATSIRVGAVTGADLAFMLAQCLTPRVLRPGLFAAFNEYELAEMPWAKHLSASEAERYETRRPFIRPQRIMKDNGADYASEVFEAACRRFGIDTTSAAARTPTDKAHVERAFGTIRTRFAQYVPGFTGGSVDRRGEHPEKEDLLDVYTLAELFDRWVSIVWQNMKHETLRDPLVPGLVHSPNSMYMAMFPVTGFVPMPLGPDDYIALLPTVSRSIQLDGITINYRRYDAPELHPFRLQKSSEPRAGGQWTVHYNPHDPSAVWVRDPTDETWIQCDWINRDAFAKPFSAAIRREAREITSSLNVLGDQESAALTIELIGQTKVARRRQAEAQERQESALHLAEIAGASFPSPESAIHAKAAGASDVSTEVEEVRMFDPEDGFDS